MSQTSPVSETPTSLIDKRLADLREANEVFRDSSWNRASEIHRNDREIRWLIDLRTVLTSGHAQGPAVLWCCHARGPDDVYAAPDYATALAWADTLNALNWDTKDLRYPKPRGFKNPSLYEDCLIKAVPAPWPHSPEAHAEDLPKSIEGFADPSNTSTVGNSK